MTTFLRTVIVTATILLTLAVVAALVLFYVGTLDGSISSHLEWIVERALLILIGATAIPTFVCVYLLEGYDAVYDEVYEEEDEEV
jgi:hypothetical protein